MKTGLLLILILAIQNYGNAQDSAKADVKDLLFSGSHSSFSIIPLVSQKAEIDPQSGPYQLGSRPVRGVEAGFNYHSNMNTGYSIILGLHGGVSVRNYSLFIPKEDFTPDEPQDFEEITQSNQTVDFYLSAPLLFEKRWLTGKDGFWNVLGGINIRFYPDQFSEGISHSKSNDTGGYYNIIELDLEVGRNFKPWVDYNFGGGYSWILGNANLVRANILVNISNKSITEGTYKIQVQGQPVSEGHYASRHSFVGLSINYIFTGCNKRLRKHYEKQK